MKLTIIILFVIILILFLINKYTIGIKNLVCLNMIINCYFILNFQFKEQQFLNIIKSYDFSITKNNNKYMIKYEKISDNIILNITIEQKNNNHKLIISFNHTYFDMTSITNIINNYIKNNTKKKNLIFSKDFYFTDILAYNLIFNYLKFNKPNRKYIKYIIKKSDILEIKNKSSKYISNIDIVISKIVNMYLSYYKSNDANIFIIKNKNKSEDYLGNSVTIHNVNINKNDIINMAQNIRDSYTNPSNNYLKAVDIYITSWVPTNNQNNNIQENGKYDNEYLILPINFFIILSIINNTDYLINLNYNAIN
jgi:hypothetical protein